MGLSNDGEVGGSISGDDGSCVGNELGTGGGGIVDGAAASGWGGENELGLGDEIGAGWDD